MVFTTPDKYYLVSGYAEGQSLLNAFDNALMKAGVGNTNLMRVSSILPPAAKEVSGIVLPYGSLVPIAYASESADIPGTLISAAVACGVPEDSSLPGVIMEHHMVGGSEKYTRDFVEEQVRSAFKERGFKLKEIKTASSSGTVQNIGSAFAAVVLWT